jgi:hypothetical protein
MKSVSRTVGVFAAAGLAVTTMVAAAPQASAATWDYTMHTDDGDPGGLIRFKANGDYVEVCDIEADGKGVVGSVTDNDTVYFLHAGGNGNCSIVSAATSGHNLKEDQYVRFEVCLTDSAHPAGIYCDNSAWWNG